MAAIAVLKGGPVAESDAEKPIFPKVLGEANGNH